MEEHGAPDRREVMEIGLKNGSHQEAAARVRNSSLFIWTSQACNITADKLLN